MQPAQKLLGAGNYYFIPSSAQFDPGEFLYDMYISLKFLQSTENTLQFFQTTVFN